MSGGGSETTTNNNPPEYVMAQHQQNLDVGNVLADRPYQPYTGPRIAGFTADQQAGIQATRNAAGAHLDTGWGVANAVGNNWTPQSITAGQLKDTDLNPYLNPYTSQVIDTTTQQITRQNDILQNQTRARAAAAGAFGGSRGAILEAENNRAFLDTLASTTANLRNTGFNNAQQAALADIGNKLTADRSNQSNDPAAQQVRLQAAQQMAQSAQARQQGDFLNAQQLLNVGEMQQGMDQSNFDLAYQDFLRQQGYPEDQLQARQGLLSGPIGSTQNSSTKSDNTGQLVGSGMMAAATIAAAMM